MKTFDSVKSLRHQINLFLDNELPTEQKEDLIKVIESSPKSQKIMENEKIFRDFVKTNFKRPEVSQDFVQSIKNSIMM
jgi:hypothetical protein